MFEAAIADTGMCSCLSVIAAINLFEHAFTKMGRIPHYHAGSVIL